MTESADGANRKPMRIRMPPQTLEYLGYGPALSKDNPPSGRHSRTTPNGVVQAPKAGGLEPIMLQLDLANHEDVVLARHGMLATEQVRRETIDAIVDAGATRLALPTAVAVRLGLPRIDKPSVSRADENRANGEFVGDVELSLLGRSSVFSACLEPDRSTAIVGTMVMQELGIAIDFANRVLYSISGEQM